MSTLNDQHLKELLRELPRHEASAEFTDRVLARLDEPSPSQRGRWIGAVAVAAALVVGVWLGAAAWRDRAEEQREMERVQAMRDEYRALERELKELRTIRSEAEPVLVLGGTEQVDFVFDLRRHAEERRKLGGARAQPTSHSPR